MPDSMLPIDDAGSVSQRTPRASQVDDKAIEATAGFVDECPRTLAEEAAQGGYAQEGDQSFPASGPRVTASTRGARDIGALPRPGYRLDTDNDGE